MARAPIKPVRHEGNVAGSDAAWKLKQHGGDHYQKMAIQPFEYSMRNGLGGAEHSIVKYVSRWKDKNGIEDLEKGLHILEMLIEEAKAGRIPDFDPNA